MTWWAILLIALGAFALGAFVGYIALLFYIVKGLNL